MPRGARLALFGIPVICSLVITTLSPLALALLLDKFPKFGVESTRDLGFMSYPGESTPRYWVIESIPFATAVFVKSANDEVRTSGVRPEPLAVQMERLPQWSVAKEPWGGHFQIGESSKAPETSFIEIAIGFPFRSLLLRVRGQVRESSDSGELGKIGPEREPGIFPAGANGMGVDEQIVNGLYYRDAPQASDVYRTLTNRVLPTHIIWPGMAGNFVFFAAVCCSPWWFLMLRRWRRARNGRCVQCGYSIAGLTSGKCPECGFAVESPQARAS